MDEGASGARPEPGLPPRSRARVLGIQRIAQRVHAHRRRIASGREVGSVFASVDERTGALQPGPGPHCEVRAGCRLALRRAHRGNQVRHTLHSIVIPSAIYAALLFTVVLLVTAAYFLMGGLPLLILKHDTPLDARFVHGFFNIYYLSTIGAATAASASYALSGRFAFAVGTALIASLAAVLRNRLMPAM